MRTASFMHFLAPRFGPEIVVSDSENSHIPLQKMECRKNLPRIVLQNGVYNITRTFIIMQPAPNVDLRQGRILTAAAGMAAGCWSTMWVWTYFGHQKVKCAQNVSKLCLKSKYVQNVTKTCLKVHNVSKMHPTWLKVWSHFGHVFEK